MVVRRRDLVVSAVHSGWWDLSKVSSAVALAPFDENLAGGRFRRISPIPDCRGEGRLTQSTAGLQPKKREPLFMPHTGRCPGLVGALGWKKNSHSH
jgi:hypothetical protein